MTTNKILHNFDKVTFYVRKDFSSILKNYNKNDLFAEDYDDSDESDDYEVDFCCIPHNNMTFSHFINRNDQSLIKYYIELYMR